MPAMEHTRTEPTSVVSILPTTAAGSSPLCTQEPVEGPYPPAGSLLQYPPPHGSALQSIYAFISRSSHTTRLHAALHA